MTIPARWCPELLATLALGYLIWKPETAIRAWQDFLDSTNTDGGHLVILLGLFVFLCLSTVSPTIEKYQGEIIGALIMGLKASGSNKTRRDQPVPGPSATATLSTASTVPDPKAIISE